VGDINRIRVQAVVVGWGPDYKAAASSSGVPILAVKHISVHAVSDWTRISGRKARCGLPDQSDRGMLTGLLWRGTIIGGAMRILGKRNRLHAQRRWLI
jgi:hypothetical protein